MDRSIFRVTNINRAITPADGTDVIDIYQPGQDQAGEPIQGVRYSGYITNIRLDIVIRSIKEISFPRVSGTATQEEIDTAMSTAEVNSQNLKLQVLVRKAGGSTVRRGRISVFNFYPSYPIDLMPYFTDSNTIDIAPDTIVSLRLEEPLVGVDAIYAWGSAIEEGVAPPFSNEVATVFTGDTVELLANIPRVIALPNPQRKLLTIANLTNPASAPVFLARANTAEVGKGIPLTSYGSSYEINNYNPYKGTISAISAQDAILAWEEGI